MISFKNQSIYNIYIARISDETPQSQAGSGFSISAKKENSLYIKLLYRASDQQVYIYSSKISFLSKDSEFRSTLLDIDLNLIKEDILKKFNIIVEEIIEMTEISKEERDSIY